MPYYLMTRKGQFQPAINTENQCVKTGRQIYEYEVKLLFNGDINLDMNGFIIKHEEIDEFIKNLSFSGSCEQMHKKLSAELSYFIKTEKQISLLGYKAIITPPMYKHEILIASLNYCWVDRTDLLPLLN